jgi:hypothetical protein
MLAAVAVMPVGIMLGGASSGQPDRAAFDRANEQRRLQAQPTYMHNPVIVRWGDHAVNVHAVLAYHPADDGTTIIYPGATMVDVPFEEFDAVVRRYTRAGAWRPTPAPEVP